MSNDGDREGPHVRPQTKKEFMQMSGPILNYKITNVIEGKFMALRLNKSNFTQFAKSAEELSEAYRRSLVADGITRAKAHEMTIKKTKEQLETKSLNPLLQLLTLRSQRKLLRSLL